MDLMDHSVQMDQKNRLRLSHPLFLLQLDRSALKDPKDRLRQSDL